MAYSEQTEEYIGELAELGHYATTPFRWLISLIKWAALLIALAGWWFYCDTAWIFGFGPYGINNRADQVQMLIDATKDVDKVGLAIDFSHRPAPYNLGDARRAMEAHQGNAEDALQNIYQPGQTQIVVGGLDNYMPIGGFTAVNADGDFYNARLPLYWTTLSDQAFDTSMPGLFDRSDAALRRKSARMYVAYENAAIMVSALRQTLAYLKLHEDPREQMVFESSNVKNILSADPLDIRTVSPEEYRRWVATSLSIRLNHAPKIHMGHLNQTITGICLVSECGQDSDADTSFFLTKYADLFNPVPALSPHQMHAVDVLNSTSTVNFWLQAAHENGIHQDKVVIRVLVSAQSFRDNVIRHGGGSLEKTGIE